MSSLYVSNWGETPRKYVNIVELDSGVLANDFRQGQPVFGFIPFDGHDIRVFSGERKPWVPDPVQSQEFSLDPHSTDDQYLDNIAKILDEIKEGRFYQLNFLRFFSIQASREAMFKKWQTRTGPFGLYFNFEDFGCASFSPEQFFTLNFQSRILNTFPIKGTVERFGDQVRDSQAKKFLENDPKNQAELSMIVDLMRNDFYKVCETESVCVSEHPHLKSFPTVHHLEARVSGRLRTGISLRECIQALTPAGSVSGTPKREVLKAIGEYEKGKRGFFMGNFFIIENGVFRSNVLIRTAFWCVDHYEYAAGSGIVVKSNPQEELNEVWLKTKVVRCD